ncbi:unnamed protein product [Cuscuta campestris]|uniref:NAC domain-containing protein n=1 Tax=Cuscuta campestris TaxID=132261 RepID=A0A484NMC2_9ASTE|nr:unnamed protein product [Cuscuta campestris]
MGGIGSDTTSFPLPPGCRFYPSDEQILCYYLSEKNGRNRSDGINVIKEINLYNFDPFDLPDSSCFRFGRGGIRRHWICFVARVLKDRRTRRAGGGYWKRKGRIRAVLDKDAGKVVLGMRKCFVFYLGESLKGAIRTDWFMYEYALPNAVPSYQRICFDIHYCSSKLMDQLCLAAFVLCRIFVKSPHGINGSENVLSSCAEESFATVRHIGIQFNGITNSATEETLQDGKKETLNSPVETVSTLENPVSEPYDDWQMRSTCHFSSGATYFEAFSPNEVLGNLEGDFLELNDLLCPLSGID